ncbi:MAG: SPOR domain-containing protein, partial [Desulfobacteraceae bacterium]|nr:SPOR domain-containing protein [Desulfobacteraceae bacterium]
APVKFDTREFQKRLADIASQYKAENKSLEETDIQFYEDLQKPMLEAVEFPNKQITVTRKIADPSETETLEAIVEPKKKVPLKVSQKSITKVKYSSESVKPVSVSKPLSQPVLKRVSKERIPEKNTKNKYTIQIAAFRDVKSAFEKISSLKAKGYKAYRTMGTAQNEIWHRVRVGHFSNTEIARKYLRKLKQDNINGIIIKQDS